MLLYLPEKLYENFKNDEKYKSKIKNAEKNIFNYGGEIDFLKTLVAYENSNDLIIDLQNYLLSKLPKEYIDEAMISFSDDLDMFEIKLNDMNIEAQLYWLAEKDYGNMALTKSFDTRNNKFIRLYESYAKPEPEKYSWFIHVMYYTKIIYEQIVKMTNSVQDSKNTQEFIDYEVKVFNDMKKLFKSKTYLNMLLSKREQMYVLYFECIGQFCNDFDVCAKKISKIIDNTDYKYNNKTYNYIIFNILCLQVYLDKMNMKKAYKYIKKITNIITDLYNNKELTMKAMNHYNNCYVAEFMTISLFVYNIIKKYMPNLFKEWNFINNPNLTDLEKRFYSNNLTEEEYSLYNPYIKNDNVYTLKYYDSSKHLLKNIDTLFS